MHITSTLAMTFHLYLIGINPTSVVHIYSFEANNPIKLVYTHLFDIKKILMETNFGVMATCYLDYNFLYMG